MGSDSTLARSQQKLPGDQCPRSSSSAYRHVLFAGDKLGTHRTQRFHSGWQMVRHARDAWCTAGKPGPRYLTRLTYAPCLQNPVVYVSGLGTGSRRTQVKLRRATIISNRESEAAAAPRVSPRDFLRGLLSQELQGGVDSLAQTPQQAGRWLKGTCGRRCQSGLRLAASIPATVLAKLLTWKRKTA